MLVNGLDAGAYASRGQSRTGALAMKLAEAGYLMEQRHDQPILLLDDVLSELDATRRSRVLETLGGYSQCLITATDLASIDPRFLSLMTRLTVTQGRVAASDTPALPQR